MEVVSPSVSAAVDPTLFSQSQQSTRRRYKDNGSTNSVLLRYREMGSKLR